MFAVAPNVVSRFVALPIQRLVIARIVIFGNNIDRTGRDYTDFD